MKERAGNSTLRERLIKIPKRWLAAAAITSTLIIAGTAVEAHKVLVENGNGSKRVSDILRSQSLEHQILYKTGIIASIPSALILGPSLILLATKRKENPKSKK